MADDHKTGFTIDPARLSFNLPGLSYVQTEQKEPEPVKEEKPPIHVSHRYGHRHISRKAASEEALSKQLDWHFREGDCYHCFSFGDVDRFDCLIESSANVNTNPRSENTVITVDRQLVADYIEIFNGIKLFDRTTEHVPVYQIQDGR